MNKFPDVLVVLDCVYVLIESHVITLPISPLHHGIPMNDRIILNMEISLVDQNDHVLRWSKRSTADIDREYQGYNRARYRKLL